MASQLPDGIQMPDDGALPDGVNLGARDRSMSAYVHVPFCRTRCGYCDFNTYTATELSGVSQSSYAREVVSEVRHSENVLTQAGVPIRPLHSVFFGGGTPTLLPVSDISQMLTALKQTHGIEPGAEITIEANPDTLSAAVIDGLAQAGITRVSVGMQSAVPAVLATLERTHEPAAVGRAIENIHRAGLDASVDLIYGAPGETLEDWKLSLEVATGYGTGHISAYALIVEQGTALARKISTGELAMPDDDLQADMYELADSILSHSGFQWYEVSNWAKSDSERSTHNMAYWQGQDWWGYGPGAHSAVGGTRFWNVKHPAAYAQRLQAGISPALAFETPSLESHDLEQVLLLSRLSEGIPAQRFPAEAVEELLRRELIETHVRETGQLVLTLAGRLRADEVVRVLAFDS